mmetsp:Transcript_36033/g.83014  ORF Transcript_36033/g.83014 Transcript_36033/m.83014 type:complete len:98 (+) Transcript_36033:135-428(+)
MRSKDDQPHDRRRLLRAWEASFEAVPQVFPDARLMSSCPQWVAHWAARWAVLWAAQWAAKRSARWAALLQSDRPLLCLKCQRKWRAKGLPVFFPSLT